LKMFAQAIASISEIVTISDLDDNIIFVNESFIKCYGYERHEVIGKNVNILRGSGNSREIIEDLRDKTLAGGWQGEISNKRKDGKEFPLWLSTSPIFDENNQPVATIGVGKDMTEDKKISDQQRRTEMLTTVRELAGAVSHEFSQPLQALSNYIDLMRENPAKKDYLDKCSKMIARIASLVSDLREITNIQRQDYLSTKIIDIKASAQRDSANEMKRVLVIDDEPDILETMVEMLNQTGYDCKGTTESLEALRLITQETFGLVISDIQMPRLSGDELYHKIRSMGYQNKFIFMTGYAIDDRLGKTIKESDGLIGKPIDFKEFINVVNKIIGPPPQ
ncbi:MAG: response regulator, partial [Caldithrix sp.]|nr:response regulator [Caldithrix sp.]